jgi:predicted TIM-barrel fold metal-dependent hydrolase
VATDDWLPVKFGPVSNGEFLPPAPDPVLAEAIRRTHDLADRNARRLGISRRRFLTSAAGAAATFWMVSACGAEQQRSGGAGPGGTYDVPPDATIDPDAARAALAGDEFVFDVQTHYVNYDPADPTPPWTSQFPQARCATGAAGGDERLCFTVDAYFTELFTRSDTSMAILSALPTASALSGLSHEDMVYAIEVAERVGCDDRVLMHGGAYPHLGPIEAALAAMDDARERFDIAAWKIYTMVPTANAFYFDDHDPTRPQIGQRFIDHVRAIGPPIICTHKGISSIVGSTPELADPSDVGPAAARNPDIAFVVYHSGFEPGGGGVGPYDPDDPNPQGVDRLVRTVLDNGIAPNSNVYAELGGTWWFLMRNPTAAAHVLGKLLKFIGTDNVVWGTDSIWFGTPQDQIQALRLFRISEEFQERFGYPALTDEVKRGIFGLNALRLYDLAPVPGACEVDRTQLELARAELPPPMTYGPTTAAEAARLIVAHQGGML